MATKFSWTDPLLLDDQLTDDERALLQAMDLETLRAELLKRLAEQKERHDGGNRWVGTGGRSPYGHGGVHPTGIRVWDAILTAATAGIVRPLRFTSISAGAPVMS